MSRPLATMAFSLGLVSVGLGAGWYAGARSAGAAPTDAEAEPEATLSKQTLATLGVAVGTAELTTHTRYTDVQAVVVDAPLNTRPVVAPLGGIVREVHTAPGAVVAGGTPLFTLVREAIPRPELKLVADMLAPVKEPLHAAFLALRAASHERTIAREERERVRKINAAAGAGEPPLISRQTEIDLDYRVRKAQLELENARGELEHHGLTAAQIRGIEAGAHPPHNTELSRQALEHHGIWTAHVTRAFEALPADLSAVPWTIALLGELAASGLVGPGLAEGLASTPAAGRRFFDAAALLLGGHSEAEVFWLAASGALEPVYELRAPDGPDGGWDVAEVAVRPGESIPDGHRVATLHDAREMWLELAPAGSELTAVTNALRAGASLRATPLIVDTGPVLEDLALDRLVTDTGGSRTIAIVPCSNTPLSAPARGRRGWELRAGLRYLVRVPRTTTPDCFVIPRTGVTERGPDRIVFLRDGASFKPQVVHVRYEDADVVVIPRDGSIFPGDPIVTRGALALGLALQIGTQGGGGHDHPHPH